MQPTFLCIDVQKGGTTSLRRYLLNHPEIFIANPPGEEVHYFDLNEHDDAYYRSLFQTSSSIIKAWGEFTPIYCYWEPAMTRIYRFNPDFKLIMLLRNPTHRAISHYYMELNRGTEHLSLREALDAEEARLLEGDEMGRRLFSYKSRGHYHEKLKRIYNFFPQEQVLLLKSESFFTDTQAVMQQVTNFLGVSAMSPQKYPVHRKGEYSEVPTRDYDDLVDYFRPHNQQLARQYGFPIDGWDKKRGGIVPRLRSRVSRLLP